MRITIPVVMDINDEQIKKNAQECGVSVEDYRAGLVEDKIEVVASLVGSDGFMVDDSKVTEE